MLVPSKFQLSSFWVILSIVVYSYCYNDSRVGFNYGNTSIEYNLESAGGHSNGLELSSIVDFNRDLDGILPDLSTAPSLEASERLPTLTDVEFSDDEDFPGVLNTLDTASPFEIPDASDILHWLSDIGLSYNHSGYDPSPSSSCPLPSLRYRSYPTQIDGVDLPSSVEGVPTHREVPRNSVPSDRDFHHQPASSTLNNELPRNPLQEERQDLPDLWILHQRTRAQLQPKPDSQPRWRFWTADDEPPQESSREWPILGTVATAAATLAFVNDAEKRRKRARSAGSDEETPPRMKLWEFQAPRLVFPPPPPSYSESVCSLDYHPLVSEYLKKLGDVDIFRERLEWHTEEKDALEREREERKRVNLVLAVADQEWLDGFSDSESKLKNQLKKAEDETEELRKECYSRGLVDEEGEPLEFKESERGASGADVVDADGELHDFVRFPLLLPIPFFQPPNHNVQRYILEQQAFGNDVNSWDSEDELASNPNLSTTLAWESSLKHGTSTQTSAHSLPSGILWRS
ncbi:hypothetical protein N431DRAFT_215029 [Stipitochalara longipes BDJ]|nr:hypothetical protein N431DRAFT_215029 [Stipitochalara longipes BDJ]